MPKQIKALVVFSGGLDSILAVKTLQDQNIEVTALCFESNFYNAEKAIVTAKQLGVELKLVNISDKMLELVKNPPNGYGKNMNPCIDCHSMMFRLAGETMREGGFDILASGEVLGQRPFSQNKEALKKVASLAGLEVLRPLSAKLLDETIYEKEGLVVRGRLHRVSGRTREGQMELVKKYNVIDYPSPAGGCLLTDPEYSKRLLAMLDNWPEADVDDIKLIKNGRVFWYNQEEDKKIIAVIGRNHEENQILEKLAKKGDIVLQLKEINGPTTLIRGLANIDLEEIRVDVPSSMLDISHEELTNHPHILDHIATKTAYYAVKARGKEIDILIEKKKNSN